MKNVLMVNGLLTLFLWIGTETLYAQDPYYDRNSAKEGINIHIPYPTARWNYSETEKLKSKRDSLVMVLEGLEEQVEKQVGAFVKAQEMLVQQKKSLIAEGQQLAKLKEDNTEISNKKESERPLLNDDDEVEDYGEILNHVFGGSIDEILDQQTESSIRFYKSYLDKRGLDASEIEEIETKIEDIERYFFAKELLNQEFDQRKISKAIGELLIIGESSERVSELMSGLRYYGEHSEKFEKLLSEQDSEDFSTKIINYLWNREINSLSEFNKYQYLSKELIVLMTK